VFFLIYRMCFIYGCETVYTVQSQITMAQQFFARVISYGSGDCGTEADYCILPDNFVRHFEHKLAKWHWTMSVEFSEEEDLRHSKFKSALRAMINEESSQYPLLVCSKDAFRIGALPTRVIDIRFLIDVQH
jgi:hypothetical protein